MKVAGKTQKENGFYLLELGLAIFIISLLATLSLSFYMPLPEKSHAIAALENSRPHRDMITIFYQVNGRWPDKKDILHLNSNNATMRDQPGSGAFTITVHEFPKEANQVTLRPVLSHTDGRGTIKWVCGNTPIRRNIHIFGENETTAWEQSLPSICR